MNDPGVVDVSRGALVESEPFNSFKDPMSEKMFLSSLDK